MGEILDFIEAKRLRDRAAFLATQRELLDHYEPTDEELNLHRQRIQAAIDALNAEE